MATKENETALKTSLQTLVLNVPEFSQVSWQFEHRVV